jgi:hypothetical protein
MFIVQSDKHHNMDHTSKLLAKTVTIGYKKNTGKIIFNYLLPCAPGIPSVQYGLYMRSPRLLPIIKTLFFCVLRLIIYEINAKLKQLKGPPWYPP